ncbi:uncharacterized protein KY384_004380 [Bacidia gigantensis]|uniref:uncharacterized protein n=1 Tax=Bacidia gigantensis TaxID=2732470 RepID=UPI001D03C179|nr:uncharacterized protein KY384_004380 [Bacidia gigantensis]KAG8531023.1 hypothetical protein KY384_004380 [Bacidia gigantensis]
MEDYSIVTLDGASYGMLSSTMQPAYYQKLADRGWRRYTIRLDASAFKSRKDQRKAANKWNRHVLGQDYRQKAARYCPKSRQETKRLKNTFDLWHTVHESEYNYITKPLDLKTQQHIVPAHKFEVTLEPDNYTKEKYDLFHNYQQNVHKESPDEISVQGFKRFLCSGLGQTYEKSFDDDETNEKKLGSYHQCYRLDGRLIALGVLDLLPNCVSSVYLMFVVLKLSLEKKLITTRYHNNFASWDFGKLSALREIDLAREAGYSYYYMDPISYDWDLLDADLRERLNARAFVSMALERTLDIPSERADLQTFIQDLLDAARPNQAIDIGNVKYETALDYVRGSKYGHPATKEFSDIFRRGMPGAMSLDEVRRSDVFPKWKITQSSHTFELKELTYERRNANVPESIDNHHRQHLSHLYDELYDSTGRLQKATSDEKASSDGNSEHLTKAEGEIEADRDAPHPGLKKGIPTSSATVTLPSADSDAESQRKLHSEDNRKT